MENPIFQAIVTKYHGPTNIRGSRVSATAAAGRLMLNWQSELSSDRNHELAAKTLANRYGWLTNRTLVGGGMPDGTGNVYVLVDLPAQR